VAVLISGSGSNLQALIDAANLGVLKAEIVLVVSNRKAAFGLTRAKNAGIETLYFPLKPYRDTGRAREEYDADLASSIAAFKPDLLICAGWMHIDSGALIERFPGRIINLHPALPGEFPGAHGIEDAFKAWQRGEISRSGCMVHHVIKDLDAGEPIATREVPFEPSETLETYSNKIHKAEHELIVESTKITLEKLQP
jgi:formyltetrahydrofolate-dependent phosphoribosylglycinamide formyltransferase